MTQPQDPKASGGGGRRIGKVEVRWALGGIIAVIFGVFVAQNSDKVPVNFVFFTANVRLIWVFLICGVIGALLDRLLKRKGIL